MFIKVAKGEYVSTAGIVKVQFDDETGFTNIWGVSDDLPISKILGDCAKEIMGEINRADRTLVQVGEGKFVNLANVNLVEADESGSLAIYFSNGTAVNVAPLFEFESGGVCRTAIQSILGLID